MTFDEAIKKADGLRSEVFLAIAMGLSQQEINKRTKTLIDFNPYQYLFEEEKKPVTEPKDMTADELAKALLAEIAYVAEHGAGTDPVELLQAAADAIRELNYINASMKFKIGDLKHEVDTQRVRAEKAEHELSLHYEGEG